MREGNLKLPNTSLCEKMLSPDNLLTAVKNVKSNKGSAGVDGKTVDMLDEFVAEGNLARVAEQILARKYKPKPVKRITIPKPNGGVRLLGVPCVVDRVIQQAMVQVLQPEFEPTFSDFSYGFRPHRSAEDAVRQAQTYKAQGYNYVVDLDLSKFFDTVNHDLLMGLIDKTMHDKDIRRLIFEYLKAGVMIGETYAETEEGTPQGGPLSPLLSNIYLTPYDKELEKRGHKFVRYADDCNIFVKSKYSAKRVKENVTRFLENKMKLKVNKEKTEARKFTGSKFLGFKFYGMRNKENNLCMCVPKDGKIEEFKKRVREITKRNRGASAKVVITELNQYIRGWINYYARSSFVSKMEDLAGWVRRRVRQYLWKQWKTPDNRRAKLAKLGVKAKAIEEFEGWSNNSYWKMAKVVGQIMLYNEILYENMERIGAVNLINIEETWKVAHEKRMKKDVMYLEVSRFLQMC